VRLLALGTAAFIGCCSHVAPVFQFLPRAVVDPYLICTSAKGLWTSMRENELIAALVACLPLPLPGADSRRHLHLALRP
jgi:hypothetical protein